uniref:ascorbate ferrireductase (transmembrane) n=1 Tax=Glossina morsitans morsitans TaxID=37546 RepID=A0A1B0G2C4_GLOMM
MHVTLLRYVLRVILNYNPKTFLHSAINMSNSIDATSSVICTDYGSTTLKITSILADGENVTCTSDSAATASTTSTFGYQRLTSVKLSKPDTFIKTPGTKSVISSRFLKMTMDMKSNCADSDTKQSLITIEYFLNIINQICIGFTTIYMNWLCLSTGLTKTSLHAWLVTLGFSFLMAEAIMCHYKSNILTFNFPRTTKTTIHWVLQVLGGGLGITGTLVKCIQKGFLIATVHGKLGFAAFILCCFSMISGLAALYSQKLKQFLSPLLNKTFHNLLGLVTFVLALTAQYYGYETGFFVRKTTEDFRILMKCIILMTLILSSVGPLKSLYHKLMNVKKNYW